MEILNPFIKKHPTLHWQLLKNKQKKIPTIYRTPVPGGWLLSNGEEGGLVFIPDAKHEWDGDSYPMFD